MRKGIWYDIGVKGSGGMAVLLMAASGFRELAVFKGATFPGNLTGYEEGKWVY